jgi:basic membrane protein A
MSTITTPFYRPLLTALAGLLVAIPLLTAAGCGSSESKPQGNGASGAAGSSKHSDLTVGVVFDSGGIGDKSFNDSANAGLERAKSELGVNTKTVSSQSEKDYQTNLDALASSGCKLVIAVGLSQGKALAAVAKDYPNVHFAIVDGSVEAPNVRMLDFAEEQGSFLAGYVAGAVSKTHTVGFVGGMELDLIKKFYTGFAAGALTANPSTNVLPPKYVGDWDNQDVAKANALQLFGSNADVVYHAAGRAGGGVITAAKEQGKFAVGVDSDQDSLAPGHVLTSMIKHVDEAVFQTIKDEVDGKFAAGQKVYDLASNGVGLSKMKYTKDLLDAKTKAALDDIKRKIIAGTIKVPATLDELKAYQGALRKS